MEFDVIEVTDEDLKTYSTVQMQLLRSAQKKKNELSHKMESDLALFKKVVYTDEMRFSSLLEQKRKELKKEFDYQVEIIKEQLLYALELNTPDLPDHGNGSEDAGYTVDYSLSYTDRYYIVRDYYLAISDPEERMSLYSNDEVAKDYLGTYYRSLYNVLYSYSK